MILRSHIAYPSPSKTDDPATHGYALKDDEIREAKAVMGLPDEAFYVPDDVRELYRAAGERGRDEREAWEKRLDAYDGDRAVLDATLGRHRAARAGRTPLPTLGRPATRSPPAWPAARCSRRSPTSSRRSLAGGADLTSNTGTVLKDHGVQSADEPGGRQVYFGIREHAMAAAMNGMALHGGVLPVGGTFLVFSDYCRPSVRLAALSRAKVIYSFTHDSVGRRRGRSHPPAGRARRRAAGHPRASA